MSTMGALKKRKKRNNKFKQRKMQKEKMISMEKRLHENKLCFEWCRFCQIKTRLTDGGAKVINVSYDGVQL
jgi:hypothetical protein